MGWPHYPYGIGAKTSQVNNQQSKDRTLYGPSLSRHSAAWEGQAYAAHLHKDRQFLGYTVNQHENICERTVGYIGKRAKLALAVKKGTTELLRWNQCSAGV
eukprot:1151902-Pelagomonas_calceolata.AAC.3